MNSNHENGNYKSEAAKASFAETIANFLRIAALSPLGRPKELTSKEIHIIDAIGGAEQAGNSPVPLSSVAEAMGAAPAVLAAALDALQNKGYAVKARNGDGRCGSAALTEMGWEARRAHLAFFQELAGEALCSLSEREAKALKRSLETVTGICARMEAEANKSAVKIIADSTCDFAPEEAVKNGITLLPMTVMIDNVVYKQGVDITVAEFYKKLEASSGPAMTTQLTYYDLEKVYQEAVSDGSEAVAIHLSSAMSGTYQSAALAAREVRGVHAVDSQNATFGSALLVREAVKMRDAGMGAAEIAEKLAALAKRVRLLAYVSTLKYLVRGGRLSAVSGVVGGVLNICPIITIQDGSVKSIGKARGRAMACKELARMAEKIGVDTGYDVAFGHSCDEAGLAALKEAVKGLVGGCASGGYDIGPIIGAHVGSGAVGLAFIAKE